MLSLKLIRKRIEFIYLILIVEVQYEVHQFSSNQNVMHSRETKLFLINS